MRHIGTDPRGEAVVLLGHKPDENMVSFLRVSGLTDKEKDWLREAILKHHSSPTLMSQLIHETSRQTGANAGEYFYRRSETGPIRDIVLTDKDQCIQWTRGITNYNPKMPNDPFIQSLTQAVSPAATGQPKAPTPPAPEPVETEAGPLAEPALGDEYYNQMANAEYKPQTVVEPVIQTVTTTTPVYSAPTGSGIDQATMKDIKRLIEQNDQLIMQNNELFGQNKKMHNRLKELDTAVRSQNRELVKAGLKLPPVPKPDGGKGE